MRQATTFSFGDLFRFPFRESDWQSRFLIGSGLILAGSFIPILPLIPVLGYMLAIIRQVVRGEEPSLPAWDDWGRLIADGLRALVVQLVFLGPGLLIMIIVMGVYFLANSAMPFVVASDPNAVMPSMLLLFGSLTVLFLGMALSSLLVLAGAVPLPVATAHLAVHDRVSAAFRAREWWPILRANKLGYFVAWVVVAGLGALVYGVHTLACYTICLCCLVPVLTAPLYFYLALIGAVLFAQTYREGAAPVAQTVETDAA